MALKITQQVRGQYPTKTYSKRTPFVHAQNQPQVSEQEYIQQQRAIAIQTELKAVDERITALEQAKVSLQVEMRNAFSRSDSRKVNAIQDRMVAIDDQINQLKEKRYLVERGETSASNLRDYASQYSEMQKQRDIARSERIKLERTPEANQMISQTQKEFNQKTNINQSTKATGGKNDRKYFDSSLNRLNNGSNYFNIGNTTFTQTNSSKKRGTTIKEDIKFFPTRVKNEFKTDKSAYVRGLFEGAFETAKPFVKSPLTLMNPSNWYEKGRTQQAKSFERDQAKINQTKFLNPDFKQDLLTLNKIAYEFGGRGQKPTGKDVLVTASIPAVALGQAYVPSLVTAGEIGLAGYSIKQTLKNPTARNIGSTALVSYPALKTTRNVAIKTFYPKYKEVNILPESTIPTTQKGQLKLQGKSGEFFHVTTKQIKSSFTSTGTNKVLKVDPKIAISGFGKERMSFFRQTGKPEAFMYFAKGKALGGYAYKSGETPFIVYTKGKVTPYPKGLFTSSAKQTRINLIDYAQMNKGKLFGGTKTSAGYGTKLEEEFVFPAKTKLYARKEVLPELSVDPNTQNVVSLMRVKTTPFKAKKFTFKGGFSDLVKSYKQTPLSTRLKSSFGFTKTTKPFTPTTQTQRATLGSRFRPAFFRGSFTTSSFTSRATTQPTRTRINNFTRTRPIVSTTRPSTSRTTTRPSTPRVSTTPRSNIRVPTLARGFSFSVPTRPSTTRSELRPATTQRPTGAIRLFQSSVPIRPTTYPSYAYPKPQPKRRMYQQKRKFNLYGYVPDFSARIFGLQGKRVSTKQAQQRIFKSYSPFATRTGLRLSGQTNWY